MKKNLLLWKVPYTNGFSLFCLYLFLITAVSCKDDNSPTSGTENRAVVFTATVGQSGTRLSDNIWSSGDEIGIAMMDDDATDFLTTELKRYTAQGGTSSSLNSVDADNTHFYPEDGSNVKFIAFYPYTEVKEDSYVVYNSFDDQSTAEKMAACDLVYSNDGASFNKDTQTAALYFAHKLSKLTINVKTSANANEAIDLSKLSVSLVDMPSELTLVLPTGVATIDSNNPITITPYAPTDGISSTAYAAHAIVLPSANKGRIVFNYNAEDGAKESSINIDNSSINGFNGTCNPGKAYKFDFTLTAKDNNIEVESTGCSTTDWTDGTWDSYTVEAKKEFTVAAAAATDNEYTFRTNYTGTVTAICSTDATDPHAGAPTWIENVAMSAAAADSDGFITYTCKFNTKENEEENERTAYLHLNVEKMNVVVKIVQEDAATIVENGDNLAAMLALATEGEVFAIMPGEYALGEFVLTKSIKLKGAKPADKPVIKGNFKVNSTVASLSLNNVIMDGNSNTNYLFNLNNSGCNIAAITISNSELNNYARGFFYMSVTNIIIGDITISNTIIKNMNPNGTSGGDAIDIRNAVGNSLGSFTAENVTFDTGFRSFIRMQLPTPPKFTFRSCTFYKICTVDNGNNTGLFRMVTGTLEVSKCLFVETGPTSSPVSNKSSGNWASSKDNMQATTTYANNYYYNCHNLWVGFYTDPADCSATEANPGFADAANGDFTLSNTELINAGIGDARWR